MCLLQSTCTHSCNGGTQTATRTITVAGTRCPELTRTQMCNMHRCPVNCEVHAWSEWSQCSKPCDNGTGGGMQTRERSVKVQPRHGGAACPALAEERKCNQHACPVDCQVGRWSSWSTCSAACAGGVQTATRAITRAAAHGGHACPPPADLTRSQPCNTQACDEPCEVSAWSAWDACDKACGGGVQRSSRTVLKPAVGHGRPCPALSREQRCHTQACAVDCEVSHWSAWSQCSRACEGGEQTRERTVLTHPAHGGKACDVLSQSRKCNKHACSGRSLC